MDCILILLLLFNFLHRKTSKINAIATGKMCVSCPNRHVHLAYWLETQQYFFRMAVQILKMMRPIQFDVISKLFNKPMTLRWDSDHLWHTVISTFVLSLCKHYAKSESKCEANVKSARFSMRLNKRLRKLDDKKNTAICLHCVCKRKYSQYCTSPKLANAIRVSGFHLI